jgi:hypothetical protein
MSMLHARAVALAGVALLLLGPTSARADASARFRVERDRAGQALAKLASRTSTQLTVHWPAHRTRPAMIRGLAVRIAGDSNVQRARRFVEGHPTLFAGRGSTLRQVETRESRDLIVVRFQQLHRGIPVDGADLRVSLDRAGRVTAVHSDCEPVDLPSVRPRLSPRAAVDAARQVAGVAPGLRANATLVILAGPTPRLAYRVAGLDPFGKLLFVDAGTGAFLGARRGMIVEVRR